MNINIHDIDIAIYVKIQKDDDTKNRDEYMKYVGGQTHLKCGIHKLLMITDRMNEKQCISPQCNNKVLFCCPHLLCKMKICKHCSDTFSRQRLNYVRQSDGHHNDNISNDDNSQQSNVSDDHTQQSQFSEDGLIEPYDIYANVDDIQNDNVDDCDDIIHELDTNAKMNEEDIHEYDMNFLGDYPDDFSECETDDEHNNDTMFCQFIHTTDASKTPKQISSDINGLISRTSGHVILNQTAKLLTRKSNNIHSSRAQKNFVESLVATVPGKCIPTLYLEGMLFPSIFYDMNNDSSINGAIPTSIMNSHNNTNCAFALPKEMYRSRLTSPGSKTSTNPSYISHSFDVISNLQLSHSDSRLILNRGFVVSANESGLSLNNRSDDRLYDSVDSKKMVRNLCSSQKYHEQTFFLTYTCNQKKHPGISKLKNYIDNGEFENKIPNWYSFSEDEREEYKASLNQSIGGLILRNWMEVRTIFINYLCNSPTSPYHPIRSIFSRDEFQGDVGNLPHIHMMAEMDLKRLNEVQKENLEELIRASLCDIIRSEDIEILKEEGIIKNMSDISEIERDAECFLRYRCSKRCLR